MLNQSNDNKFFPDTRHLTPEKGLQESKVE